MSPIHIQMIGFREAVCLIESEIDILETRDLYFD